jgi:hypothetical protein
MYTYDIFISYSSQDKEWAEKLETELTNRNFTVFRDQRRLIAGDSWEEQLKQALTKSQHMIVLWSDKASKSDWVTKETSYFSVAIVSDKNRKLIPIALDDTPSTNKSVQAIHMMRSQNFYQQGAQAVPSQVWRDLAQKIYQDINTNDDRIPINLAILTLTKSEIDTVNFQKKPTFGETLESILQNAGYTEQQIKQQYGQTKNDWKPFGGNKSIMDVLDEMLTEINTGTKLNYKWAPINHDKFWGSQIEELQSEVERLKKELSVIIIDPVAMYDQGVADRFELLMDCLENKDALVITFSSFDPPSIYSSWRKLLEFTARRFYRTYFDPPIPKTRLLAHFTANPLDKKDARRYIRYIISESTSSNSNKNVFIQQ